MVLAMEIETVYNRLDIGTVVLGPSHHHYDFLLGLVSFTFHLFRRGWLWLREGRGSRL